MVCAAGNVNMEGENVEQIALPRNRFAVCREFQTSETGDGAIGAMVAGNPLWVIQSQRPRLHSHYDVTADYFQRGLGRIHDERDRLARLSQNSRRYQCDENRQAEHKTRCCSNHYTLLNLFAVSRKRVSATSSPLKR